jgi:hypothetical protein
MGLASGCAMPHRRKQRRSIFPIRCRGKFFEDEFVEIC